MDPSPESGPGIWRRPHSTLKVALAAVAVVVVLALLFASASCHGHVIRSSNLPGSAADFDFSRPPCSPGPQPAAGPGDVLLRYLGVSGLYVRWRGVAILTAPFFTRYGGGRVAFGKVDADLEAIEHGMTGLPDTPIRAVLVGHTHFDHLGDLPEVLRGHAPDADVYLNLSGKNMLDGAPQLDNAFIDVGPSAGTWIRLRDPDGAELPVRIMPIESGHAPQARGYRFATGDVLEPWHGLAGHRLRKMKGGQTHAYLIDLLNGDDTVAFRLHYQDSASAPPLGFPTAEVADEREVDVAVICMPSYWLAPGYPVELLGRVRTHHVLMTHYEDFFRSREKPLRFVALLTDNRANTLIETVREAMSDHLTLGPTSDTCGPGDNAWTMPLPGEWLRFKTKQ